MLLHAFGKFASVPINVHVHAQLYIFQRLNTRMLLLIFLYFIRSGLYTHIHNLCALLPSQVRTTVSSHIYVAMFLYLWCQDFAGLLKLQLVCSYNYAYSCTCTNRPFILYIFDRRVFIGFNWLFKVGKSATLKIIDMVQCQMA